MLNSFNLFKKNKIKISLKIKHKGEVKNGKATKDSTN